MPSGMTLSASAKAPDKSRRQPSEISLYDALKAGWIEFLFQPKIELENWRIVGAEMFARVCHPDFGMLPPSAFLPCAGSKSLEALAEHSLLHALTASADLCKAAINLRLAINIPLIALGKLNIAPTVHKYRPPVRSWEGLLIDVTEDEVADGAEHVDYVVAALTGDEVALALDELGGCVAPLLNRGGRVIEDEIERAMSRIASVKRLKFAEMKLHRSFVAGCSRDRRKAGICKAIIDLAHNRGSRAVAVGVEQGSDVAILQSMGCDLAQGNLFSEPIAQAQFVKLMRNRPDRFGLGS
jgi:EAL domain-containing protein (putative c-di-GMP-specific phosphodiesterase class I)